MKFTFTHEVVEILLTTLNFKDPITYNHSLRVAHNTKLLAQSLGLDKYKMDQAVIAGWLHDIGKVGVDREILNKPGLLTDEEFKIMKQHSSMSSEILSALKYDSFFSDIIPAIRHHHERMDGNGYPDQISADRIPLLSRILMVCDTYDAMSQDRPYRKGLSDEVIYKELLRCSGSQFDPEIVKVFLTHHHSWEKTTVESHDNVVSFVLEPKSKKVA